MSQTTCNSALSQLRVRSHEDMEPTNIAWISTPTGVLATILDTHGRVWAVRIDKAIGLRTEFTVTMLCAEAGSYRSHNHVATLAEGQEWCYKQLRSVDA